MIRSGTMGLFVSLLLASELQAAGPPDDKPAAPREKLEALKRESEKAYGVLERRRGEAQDEAAKQDALEQYWKELQTIVGRAIKLVEDHPDDPASLDVLIWITDTLPCGIYPGNTEMVGKAFDILAKRWVTSEKLAPTCYYGELKSVASPQALHFLQSALEKSPYRSVRGAACLGLAWHYRDSAHLGAGCAIGSSARE